MTRRIPHHPYAVLRIPNFHLLIAMQYITSITSQLQAVAVGWQIYERTGSSERTLKHPFGDIVHVWKMQVILALISMDLPAVLFGGATALLVMLGAKVFLICAGCVRSPNARTSLDSGARRRTKSVRPRSIPQSARQLCPSSAFFRSLLTGLSPSQMRSRAR